MTEGKSCIAVIGIDKYRRWNPLSNAVSDAYGIRDAFEALGFESIVEPLINEAATGDALRRLPGDLRAKLSIHDSLVVFFAGHGHTVTWPLSGGPSLTCGFLIPADADSPDGRHDSWEQLELWLHPFALLPARHVLMIIDSCHSGIALGHETASRGYSVSGELLSHPLRDRRSRRVITSALGDQLAADGGPVPGHSLFTGTLLHALRTGIEEDPEVVPVTAMDIASRVQRQVRKLSRDRQIPAIGTLAFHDNGELCLPWRMPAAIHAHETPMVSRAQPIRARASSSPSPCTPRAAGQTSGHKETGSELPTHRTESWALETTLAAKLDWQAEVRKNGAVGLSVVAGEPMAAQIAWGTWAAKQGYLTLLTDDASLDGAIEQLLTQIPWLRCISEARKRLAAAAGIRPNAVDATLDAKAGTQRQQWIEDVGALNAHARVSGWLLCELRKPKGGVPDPATAPVTGARLLSIACDLASPTAVLFLRAKPDAAWLERAIGTAANLVTYMPHHSVAVTAPDALVTQVLRTGRPCGALTMAREGLVKMIVPAQRLPGRARRQTTRVLFEALAADPRTRGQFELDARIEVPRGPPVEVDLVAHRARIAVELDGWYHFHDPEGYRRDRIQDTRLGRAGYFVLRFPAEDVDDRLASTLDHIAIALAGRRASAAPY